MDLPSPEAAAVATEYTLFETAQSTATVRFAIIHPLMFLMA